LKVTAAFELSLLKKHSFRASRSDNATTTTAFEISSECHERPGAAERPSVRDPSTSSAVVPPYGTNGQPGAGSGGGATGTVALRDGDFVKSNMSVSVDACPSRSVRCGGSSSSESALRKRFSMSARSEVWSATVCDTYCGFENGETAMNGTRMPS
jgi:hypothetical protein